MADELVNQIKKLSELTGVYLFRDKPGRVIYVGKAVNLKKRVTSYFNRNHEDPKVQKMIGLISNIETRQTKTEIEALLLEADLIKRLRPIFNIRLKDDTFYSYIRITDEEFPKVEKSRKKNLPGTYFGPYPLGNVTQILRDLRRFFPFRDCSEHKFQTFRKLGRPCLYGDLGLCPAPCVLRVNSQTYKIQIKYIKDFLSGRRRELMKSLEDDMKDASQKQAYEKASFFRDQINRLNFLAPVVLSEAERTGLGLPTRNIETEIKQLADYLGLEVQSLARIEAYDISNFSGKYPTGSMVVLANGQIDKDSYRRFRIRGKDSPNDYRMMAEVLKRRLTNPSLGPWPALILVDGGKGQLSTAVKVQKELGISIPVAALAKRMEEIYVPKESGEGFRKIVLSKSSAALHLLQKIRDESHRFALAYHRLLRKKGTDLEF